MLTGITMPSGAKYKQKRSQNLYQVPSMMSDCHYWRE